MPTEDSAGAARWDRGVTDLDEVARLCVPRGVDFLDVCLEVEVCFKEAVTVLARVEVLVGDWGAGFAVFVVVPVAFDVVQEATAVTQCPEVAEEF